MSKPAIGFIGLGLMGSAMVQNLLDKGYTLTVLGHRDRTGIEAALARGATEAATAREVAEASDIVMLCMGTSEHVEGRMRGPDGVIAGLKDGAIVIDYGTSLPGSTKALGEEVAAAGGTYLDAPLGRTPSHGREGKLNIMCSGDKAAYEKVKPVLDDQGENVFHLGALGNGHTIKLINNFFAMTTANAMSEAFAMADLAGVDRKQLFDVMGAGPLRSGMMEFIAAYGVDGNAEMLAFSIKNASKDVGYYRSMAEGLGVESIMSACADKGLKAAIEDGRGEDLVPQMVDFYASRYGK
ncbi:NAD(P)-dependent oxidoreductase [Jannaschia seohaensis]|uniref:2-hydroxy-3-oxopropionate reductase n=1 Tax=Jannaschia seohaensis TaxID=475081 RepID=A0A2Y9C7K2_9RHOB|nr:NAD(P)-dependent oxidoreductase [Jannaschia seohaensis]PWJ19221.1 2-hydroxy-3-oxopropionate reductase [Jannaschia seohaensis]SSA45883.1 2-hydroxy-3-oxopropionate reductase [Jannaschia seohaensis]